MRAPPTITDTASEPAAAAAAGVCACERSVNAPDVSPWQVDLPRLAVLLADDGI